MQIGTNYREIVNVDFQSWFWQRSKLLQVDRSLLNSVWEDETVGRLSFSEARSLTGLTTRFSIRLAANCFYKVVFTVSDRSFCPVQRSFCWSLCSQASALNGSNKSSKNMRTTEDFPVRSSHWKLKPESQKSRDVFAQGWAILETWGQRGIDLQSTESNLVRMCRLISLLGWNLAGVKDYPWLDQVVSGQLIFNSLIKKGLIEYDEQVSHSTRVWILKCEIKGAHVNVGH